MIINDKYEITITPGVPFNHDGKVWEFIGTNGVNKKARDALETIKVDGVIYRNIPRYKLKKRLEK